MKQKRHNRRNPVDGAFLLPICKIVYGITMSATTSEKQITTTPASEHGRLAQFMYAFPDTYADAPYCPEIQAIRTGIFTDMTGRTVEITTELLDAIVANFAANKAGQEIPIDIMHERREAVGWLLGCRQLNGSLYISPNWTWQGRELVSSKTYKYVSCTIALDEQLLVSVSLTNFPAVKNLKPLELSEGAKGISIFFSEVEAPMPNEENQATPANTAPATPPPVAPESPVTQVAPVAVDLSQMRTELTGLMQSEVAAFRAQVRSEFAAILRDANGQRQQIVEQTLQEVRAERALTEFCDRVTATGKHALPIPAADLLTQFSKWPASVRQEVQALLATIHQSGTVDLSAEVGTSAGVRAAETRPLDPAMRVVLSSHIAEGGTIEDFFRLNADILGAANQYDLREFSAGKEK